MIDTRRRHGRTIMGLNQRQVLMRNYRVELRGHAGASLTFDTDQEPPDDGWWLIDLGGELHEYIAIRMEEVAALRVIDGPKY